MGHPVQNMILRASVLLGLDTKNAWTESKHKQLKKYCIQNLKHIAYSIYLNIHLYVRILAFKSSNGIQTL